MAKPNNRSRIALDDRGVYVNDPGGHKNGVYIGTEGNVTLEDVGWEAGLFSPTVTVESELEKLISDLADEAGVTEIEFASFLFTVGIISLAGSATQTLFPSSPGWSISGELELDNAIMEVGDIVNLGDGNDVIRAGTGNDIVFGGDGNDQLRGEDGNDALFGGARSPARVSRIPPSPTGRQCARPRARPSRCVAAGDRERRKSEAP